MVQLLGPQRLAQFLGRTASKHLGRFVPLSPNLSGLRLPHMYDAKTDPSVHFVQ